MDMFNTPILSNSRSAAIEAFRNLRTQAALGQLPALLFGKRNRLEAFTEHKASVHLTPRSLGVQDITIENIVGSVDRQDDFDSQFRPLKDHLAERWANIYMHLEHDDLPPIKVFQICDRYFVEDGHHRVSAARFAGRKFIQAEVWDYPQRITCTLCAPVTCVGARQVNY
jgi:hypothetical protein